jgi:hypothetical protein
VIPEKLGTGLERVACEPICLIAPSLETRATQGDFRLIFAGTFGAPLYRGVAPFLFELVHNSVLFRLAAVSVIGVLLVEGEIPLS